MAGGEIKHFWLYGFTVTLFKKKMACTKKLLTFLILLKKSHMAWILSRQANMYGKCLLRIDTVGDFHKEFAGEVQQPSKLQILKSISVVAIL